MHMASYHYDSSIQRFEKERAHPGLERFSFRAGYGPQCLPRYWWGEPMGYVEAKPNQEFRDASRKLLPLNMLTFDAAIREAMASAIRDLRLGGPASTGPAPSHTAVDEAAWQRDAEG